MIARDENVIRNSRIAGFVYRFDPPSRCHIVRLNSYRSFCFCLLDIIFDGRGKISKKRKPSPTSVGYSQFIFSIKKLLKKYDPPLKNLEKNCDPPPQNNDPNPPPPPLNNDTSLKCYFIVMACCFQLSFWQFNLKVLFIRMINIFIRFVVLNLSLIWRFFFQLPCKRNRSPRGGVGVRSLHFGGKRILFWFSIGRLWSHGREHGTPSVTVQFAQVESNTLLK